MTSSIPNTLSAILKESNYLNQIYSSENGYKFSDSQSFDHNDERSDPKYGDLFYEDYKKKMMKKINQKKIQREKIQLSILQFQKKLKMKSLEIRENVLNLKKIKICQKKKVIMKTLRLKATMIVF